MKRRCARAICVPFAAAISGDAAQIVMAAHVVVEALDALRPASLSPRILTGLLRDELGFDGVACTDCLQMDAIARDPGTVAGAVAAFAAGADLLLVSHSLALAREAADAIAAAIEGGHAPARAAATKRRGACARCANGTRCCGRTAASSMRRCR